MKNIQIMKELMRIQMYLIKLYDTEKVGLIQIEYLNKNNGYKI